MISTKKLCYKIVQKIGSVASTVSSLSTTVGNLSGTVSGLSSTVNNLSSKFVTGSYVYNDPNNPTTTISFTDANISGKSYIICGAQDAGNPPLRASISGTTITVEVSGTVTVQRINYICW